MKALGLPALRYSARVPLGLTLAVLLTAVLVSLGAAQFSARAAHVDLGRRVEGVVALLAVQARPLLASEDVWQLFRLLRNVQALLPGGERGLAGLSALDPDGRVIASSTPLERPVHERLLDRTVRSYALPATGEIRSRMQWHDPGADQVLVEPVHSEDGALLGFLVAEIDAEVFHPDWLQAMAPSLIGSALALLILVPMGWRIGSGMALPVARIARCIERIGRDEAQTLREQCPVTADPELSRIGEAVRRLLTEMQEREAAERRALSAERLAAVGRITAAVAHEINNPLGGLHTVVATLRQHGDQAQVRGRALDLIQRGLQQIGTTLAALLPQARAETRPFDRRDLDDILMLVHAALARQDIELQEERQWRAAALVPATPLRQVLLNLLLNAIKAASAGGRIGLRCCVDVEHVRLEVSNSGLPFAQDQLEQCLSEESGDDPHGFGLWICHQFAAQLDGSFHAATPDTADVTTCLVFEVPNRSSSETTAAA